MEIVSRTSEPAFEAVDDVELTHLVVGERMSVQHFHIEPGALVPQHAHPHEQAGFIFAGELTFLLPDDGERTVGPGESYLLAGDEPHAAENRGEDPVRGMDVFSPPRANPDWLDET
ncbi:MAG: cupin domain-containing protein [Halobacteriales archaeon]